MFVELQGAVEDAGGRILSPDTLNEVQSVRELLTAVQRVDKSKKLADEPPIEEKKDEEDVEYLVGSGNRRGIAGMREWSCSGAGFAAGTGKPEPASGPQVNDAVADR